MECDTLFDLALFIQQHEESNEEETGIADYGVPTYDRPHLRTEDDLRAYDFVHNAINAYDPTDPYVHAHGIQLRLCHYIQCIHPGFLKDVSGEEFDVLRDEPRQSWTYSEIDVPVNSTFVYIKIAREKVSWHREVCEDVIANVDGLHSVFTIQILKDLESFKPDDVINVTYVGETINFISRMSKKYPLFMELLGITYCGIVAAMPNGTKGDCRAIESLILSCFQYKLRTDNLHQRMFNLNLVHGDLQTFSREKMNGRQLDSFLAQNHHDYKDTKLRMVPNVHPSIIAMMELYAEEIAAYLRLSTEQVLSSLTLGEFCRFWGHIVGTKCYTEGLGLWGEVFLNENIPLW
ncbi:hypothetical protein ACHAWO_006533 [Cyclotella atomus]|uniref:Uncharacterized protein n=1 Tax=Cyclotella atomus TaxID=382360 RepID=A0ABD3MWF7_9STRA